MSKRIPITNEELDVWQRTLSPTTRRIIEVVLIVVATVLAAVSIDQMVALSLHAWR